MSEAPLNLPGYMHVAPDADTLYDDLCHALMAAAFKAGNIRSSASDDATNGRTR